MPRSTRTTLLLLLAATASLGACRRNRPAAPPAPEPVPVANDDSARLERERLERERLERERLERERLERERAERERIEAMRRTVEATIYFAYDRSDLTAEARAALDAKLPILTSTPGMRIVIEGHTDSRGSDEYNLALGQRRAAAAKRYLTQRDIDPSRIEVASFGEERGTCAEEEESCWSRNRRDEFRITAGGPTTARR